MTTICRFYRGLEVHPLVYPHRPAEPGFGHNYDDGFDAAVRIQEPQNQVAVSRSRVFRLEAIRPFRSAGDARRASTEFAERMIDSCPTDASVFDRES